MLDRDLRALERRWLQTRSPVDREAFMAALARAASSTLGALPVVAEDVAELGSAEVYRAELALREAEAHLPAWLEVHPGDDRPQSLLACARLWLRCPCQDHAELVAQAVRAVELAVGDTPWAAGETWDSSWLPAWERALAGARQVIQGVEPTLALARQHGQLESDLSDPGASLGA